MKKKSFYQEYIDSLNESQKNKLVEVWNKHIKESQEIRKDLRERIRESEEKRNRTSP